MRRRFSGADGAAQSRLQPRRHIDAVAENVAVFDDHIAKIEADAIVERTRRRHVAVWWVEAARHDRVKRKTTANMAAYEYVLAGKILHHKSNRARPTSRLFARSVAPSSSIQTMPMLTPGWRA